MAKRYAIQKGVIKKTNQYSASVKGTYDDLNKILREVLRDFNVPAYDACCPDFVSAGLPVRFDTEDDLFQYFNPETDTWVNAGDLAFGDIEASSVATGDISISEAGGIVSNNYLVPFYPQAPQDDIAAGTGGAISVINHYTTINTDAGGDTFTLSDGAVVGQVKRIRLVVDGGGDGVLTPANFVDTTITFNDAGDEIQLMWDGVQWFTLINSGTTIA